MSAGAGIVTDSDPAFEQQECINKAKALFGVAGSQTPPARGRGQ
jgi:anthranilate synthase component 1